MKSAYSEEQQNIIGKLNQISILSDVIEKIHFLNPGVENRFLTDGTGLHWANLPVSMNSSQKYRIEIKIEKITIKFICDFYNFF